MDSKDTKNEIIPADIQTPFIIYGNNEDQVKVKVFLQKETIWLPCVHVYGYIKNAEPELIMQNSSLLQY